MANTMGRLIPAFICAIRANQVSTEQQHELLRELRAQRQGGEGGDREAWGGIPPGEPSLPHTKTEEQVHLAVWPQSLAVDLPWKDEDVDEAVDGVLHWDRAVGLETFSSMEVERSSSMALASSRSMGQSVRIAIVSKRSSPMEPGRRSPGMQLDKRSPIVQKKNRPVERKTSPTTLKRSSPMGPGTTSLKGLERSSPTGPDRSSSMGPDMITSMGGPASTIPAALGRSTLAETRPQQQVPTGRARGQASPGPCRAAWCLREGCARLWRCLKAWWRHRCRPRHI